MEDKVLGLIKNLTFTFGLAILLPLTMHKGIELIFPYPEQAPHEEKQHPKRKEFKTEEEWEEAKELFGKQERKEHEEQRKAREAVLKEYNGCYFYIALVISILYLLAGLFMPVQSIGAGFLIGGIFSMFIAVAHYWTYFNDLAKFICLVGVIILLMGLAFYLAVRDKRKL